MCAFILISVEYTHAFLILILASEYRSWLLYYSLPVLHGVLAKEYVENVVYLISALHLLLQESISDVMIDDAKLHCNLFVQGYEKLYGKYKMM